MTTNQITDIIIPIITGVVVPIIVPVISGIFAYRISKAKLDKKINNFSVIMQEHIDNSKHQGGEATGIKVSGEDNIIITRDVSAVINNG